MLANPKSTDSDIVSARLYNEILRPIATQMGGHLPKRLLVVPHGPLHYVPFAALADDTGPILSQTGIRVAPSLSALLQSRHRNDVSARTGLILGNPTRDIAGLELPGAEIEAREISKIFPNSLLFIGPEATANRIRLSAAGKAFLHIAAHGEFKADRPLDSRLLLAPEGGLSGDFTVGQIYATRLNVPLAVLSACQTGLSEVAPGDDLIGLERGFLFAGVNSVIGSYWSVSDDATKIMMTEFYAKIKSGLGTVTALREAQMAVKRSFPHPFFWAPFAVMGEDARI